MNRLDVLYRFEFDQDFPTDQPVRAVPFPKRYSPVLHSGRKLSDDFQSTLAEFDG